MPASLVILHAGVLNALALTEGGTLVWLSGSDTAVKFRCTVGDHLLGKLIGIDQHNRLWVSPAA